MPDYCACVNTTCSLRSECARYRMEHSGHQTFAHMEQDDDEYCEAWIWASDAPFHIHTFEEAERLALARKDEGRTG